MQKPTVLILHDFYIRLVDVRVLIKGLFSSIPNQECSLLFQGFKYIANTGTEEHDIYNGPTEMDFKKQHAGYQAAYVRLSACESAKLNPLTYVGDLERRNYSDLSQSEPMIKSLLGAADSEVIRPFLQGE